MEGRYPAASLSGSLISGLESLAPIQLSAQDGSNAADHPDLGGSIHRPGSSTRATEDQAFDLPQELWARA
jgi:hypothetical protein